MTRELAEALVRDRYPDQTPTHAVQMPAYPNDPDPAWVILTSSDKIFITDGVTLERYDQTQVQDV